MKPRILCIVGPTASGKSSRAVFEALQRQGEVISVDSRQVYRGLTIGTEKISEHDMQGVPHHLIDVREVTHPYSASDFVTDAERLIEDIAQRGKLPILAGGTSFYFDALLRPLPKTSQSDPVLRAQLAKRGADDLYAEILVRDPRRAHKLDPKNHRRLVRALEIIETQGAVPERLPVEPHYDVDWIIIDPPREELRPRIDARLQQAFDRGLIDEVRGIADHLSVPALNELGLEYRIVGEYLRGERTQESLLPALSAKLWQYARRQKAWLRKLQSEIITPEASLHPDRN